MSRGQARWIHLAQVLVGGSGLIYAWMLYILEADDEFSVWNHPLQGAAQAAHILTAPILVFAVAAIWPSHVWQRIRSGYRTRRSTGLALATSFLPMVFSAYALQVSVHENWRQLWLVVHLATSAIWLLAFVAHLLHRLKQRRDGSVAASHADLR